MRTVFGSPRAASVALAQLAVIALFPVVVWGSDELRRPQLQQLSTNDRSTL